MHYPSRHARHDCHQHHHKNWAIWNFKWRVFGVNIVTPSPSPLPGFFDSFVGAESESWAPGCLGISGIFWPPAVFVYVVNIVNIITVIVTIMVNIVGLSWWEEEQKALRFLEFSDWLILKQCHCALCSSSAFVIVFVILILVATMLILVHPILR